MTDELIWLARIAYAVALGFAIGFERKLRFKEAGIRTHTIVCAGSALIMVVSKYAFSDIAEYDASRVAAQIVSGIGFLGAGMIIYRKQVVHGLTTAAGVWATAGVGMAAGGGLYIVAAGVSLVSSPNSPMTLRAFSPSSSSKMTLRRRGRLAFRAALSRFII